MKHNVIHTVIVAITTRTRTVGNSCPCVALLKYVHWTHTDTAGGRGAVRDTQVKTRLASYTSSPASHAPTRSHNRSDGCRRRGCCTFEVGLGQDDVQHFGVQVREHLLHAADDLLLGGAGERRAGREVGCHGAVWPRRVSVSAAVAEAPPLRRPAGGSGRALAALLPAGHSVVGLWRPPPRSLAASSEVAES